VAETKKSAQCVELYPESESDQEALVLLGAVDAGVSAMNLRTQVDLSRSSEPCPKTLLTLLQQVLLGLESAVACYHAHPLTVSSATVRNMQAFAYSYSTSTLATEERGGGGTEPAKSTSTGWANDCVILNNNSNSQ
jgi:hypothetical protein